MTETKQVYAEGVIPGHDHEWEWYYPGYAEDGVEGLICMFTWLTPPGPRGKKPRVNFVMKLEEIRERLWYSQKAY
jgi:hypothetical protein